MPKKIMLKRHRDEEGPSELALIERSQSALPSTENSKQPKTTRQDIEPGLEESPPSSDDAEGRKKTFFSSIDPVFFQPKPHLSPELISTLLFNVSHGNQSMTEKILLQPNSLRYLLAKGDVEDYSGRRFNKITAFQYAVWAGDEHMWAMMINRLMDAHLAGNKEAENIKQGLKQQLEELETSGIHYTVHGKGVRESRFDFRPSIAIFQTYLEYLQSKTAEECKAYYETTVIPTRQTLPAYAAQEYCRRDRPFFLVHEHIPGEARKMIVQTPSLKEAEFPRRLDFFNPQTSTLAFWWPDASTSTGEDIKYRYATEHWPRPVRRSSREESKIYRWSKAIHGHDLLAVTALCETQQEKNRADLKHRLTSPFPTPEPKESTSSCVIS